MKLTIALILIFNFQLLAKGFSQSRVTLDIKSADFKRILSQVEKKTSYRFVFSTKKIPTAIFKDIKADNQEVSDFIGQLLNGTGYTYQLLNNNLIVIVAKGELVKDIPITGKVVDETDQPLVGVTIKVKGAATGGVATDVNGTFHITAPEKAVLVVSYIGYDTQEVAVEGQNTLTIKLKSSAHNKLNEVVIIGYGTQRKRDVTGAVSSISGDALQEVPAQANISESLQGRIAGLDISSTGNSPGASNQIRLRGERSFAPSSTAADATNGPLFVLDGVPFINGSLNDINPNDISSIEVLKDASATAIYGSRASGGVILVTTKRGKNGKTLVDFNTVTGISNAVGHYNVMNAQQYTAFKQEAIAGNSISPGTTSYPITVAEQAGINNGTNTDWVKLLMRSGIVSENQLRISGGNEKTQFAISSGYRNEKGIEYGQSFNRGSMLFSLDTKISKVFKVGITSNNVLSYQNNAGDFISQAFLLSPLVSPYNADGTVNVRPTTGTLDQLVRINPLTLRNPNIQNVTRRIATNNVVYGEANIIDGLKFRLNASLSYNQSQGNVYNPVNTIVNSNTTQDQSSASISNGENYVYVIENLLTYDKTFGKHHIMFTGLFSTEKDHTQSSGLNATGIPADYLQSYNLYVANSTSPASIALPYSERGLISYMARAFYGFNDKYLLTATVRRDGSSVLGPGHQYFTYPAFAFGWNVDRENFMKSVTWVNSLKLRAGYGVTADQNITPYQILGNLNAVAYNFGPSSQNGYLISTIANPNLKFEHTNNVNLGVDFGVLNNRLNGSIDVYTQRTYDILQVESLPLSAGAATTTVNAGNSKGKGLEISLSSQNLVGAFKWTTDFNIAFARYSITALRNGLQQDIGNGWFVGQPFDVIYDYKKIGIWQTSEAAQAAVYGEKPGMIKVQDVNNNGKIDANDRQIIGTYQPSYTAGLTNRFSYKGFDLTTVIFARMGQKVDVNYLYNAAGFFNLGRVNQINVNYWTPTNPTNDFARPDASLSPLYGQTVGIQDGSFIKMRSISLAYNLPPSILKNGPVKSLKLSAIVNNPFIIYSPLVSKGLAFDPESNGYGGTDGRALTISMNLAQTRVWSIGINAGF